MRTSTALQDSNQLYDEIVREQEAAHHRDMKRLSDLGFTFLNAANGDRDQAADCSSNRLTSFIKMASCRCTVIVWCWLEYAKGSNERETQTQFHARPERDP